MNSLKKIVGILCILLAPVIIYMLVSGAITNVGNGIKDINKPIPWVIIITIFTPVAIGLMLFGFYAFKGEYNKLPSD